MPSEELSPASLRILLVEDNPDDALLLERHLRKNGLRCTLLRVETASEMDEALQTAQPLDAVIADYNLPRFSGPDALRLLRSSGTDIPFIMMSGAISEETAVASMRAGAQDYVTKQNLARLIPVLERELREAGERRNRAAAEVALKASQERFDRLVEAMPLGLLIADAEGRLLYANQSAERLLAYGAGELVQGGGAVLEKLCPDLGAERMSSAVAEPFETVCHTASGDTVEVLVGLAVLNPEGPLTDRRTAAFLADLTFQKKSQELLRRTEKLAVAGRLAASIAHEINNPLEAITNCLYLVGKCDLPQDARTYLALAQDELDRVAQITIQTLRFYRRSTHAAETNLHDLIQTVVTLLDSRLRRQSVAIRRKLGNLPLVVAHDGEIRQVLANLVGNAIDALPQGGAITLSTKTGRNWKTGQPGVRLSVADNGTGMSAATLNRIFEPFFSTKGITGTGLGLWVSREIIDKHHGTLQARSRERREGIPGGTVFTLWIPLRAPAHINPAPAALIH